ncbi:MAG: single-stranded DNA-binding protein [Spirochaetaceae bacterium]|jgi:single-strand DNA-binding protein|nr:single-stranded DNA-binding protein [Spirochaetaceae bacterium]
MNQLNSVIIDGNACKDAETRTFESGTAVCKISIASNRYYKSGGKIEKEVSFFDVECFGKIAELCGQKVKKGDEVRVAGRLKQNRWQGSDGKNRAAVVIVAEHMKVRPKPQDGGQNSPEQGAEFNDNDIPF